MGPRKFSHIRSIAIDIILKKNILYIKKCNINEENYFLSLIILFIIRLSGNYAETIHYIPDVRLLRYF